MCYPADWASQEITISHQHLQSAQTTMHSHLFSQPLNVTCESLKNSVCYTEQFIKVLA